MQNIPQTLGRDIGHSAAAVFANRHWHDLLQSLIFVKMGGWAAQSVGPDGEADAVASGQPRLLQRAQVSPITSWLIMEA